VACASRPSHQSPLGSTTRNARLAATFQRQRHSNPPDNPNDWNHSTHVHIDVPRKTLGAWQTADTMGFFQALPDLWPGWQTECWDDRYEEHVTRCAVALRVPELDLVAGVDSAEAWIRKRVFQSFEDGPAGQIVKLSELLAPVAPGFVVNDDAVEDCAVRPSKAEWARFVDACNLLRGWHAESA
jgi:hypothetical protein